MFKKSIALFLLWALCTIGSAWAQETFPFKARIAEDDVNVRADSTVSATAIVQLSKDQSVYVVSSRFDWYKIQLPKESRVYVKASFINAPPLPTAAPASANNTPDTANISPTQGTVNADNVNMRLKPDINAPILGKLKKETSVTIHSQTAGWYAIEPIAAFGWIHSRFLTKTNSLEGLDPKMDLAAQEAAKEAAQEAARALEREQKDRITLTGTIHAIKRLFRHETSYRLESFEGDSFVLRADPEALKTLAGRHAKITGKIIADQNEKFPVVQVTSLEAAP